MNILLFNTLYAPYKVGGAELSVQALAEGFIQSGHKVGVVTLGDENEELRLNGVRVVRLKINNIYWPYTETKRSGGEKLKWHIKDVYNMSYKNQLHEIIYDFKPDVIHTNNLAGFSTYIWKLANKYNIRIVHTLRDYYLQCPRTTKYKNNKLCKNNCLECKILSYPKKESSKYVDVVVGLSNHILEDHIGQGYFQNAEKKVVFNGFKFPYGNNTKSNFTFQSMPYIRLGYIGRMDVSKGVGLLIDSLLELKDFKNWELNIGGTVSLETQNNFKKKLGERINILGYVEQETFFNSIDVLVVPSIWDEPFGRVVVEGLLHRKNVLGAKSGGIPQLLDFNEKYLFYPTVESLTQRLRVILNHPEYFNDFEFSDEFLSQFKIETIIDKYLQIFQNKCSKK